MWHVTDIRERSCEKCFIHRNTVNNYVKKAEEIMGIDLSSREGKARLYVALCVEDIL